MLSLAEMRRAVGILDHRIAGSRLQKVVQPDPHSLVLSLYGLGRELHVLLDCRPQAARLSLRAGAPRAPATPPNFTQSLRARLRGSRCVGAALAGDDRQAVLHFAGPAGEHGLLLSILGPRSNLYLLDADSRLLASLRPLAETRRDLVLGEPWRDPPSAAPREGDDRWPAVADDDYLEAIEASYAARELAWEADDLRRRVGGALRREVQFLDKRATKLAADLEAATAATGGRRLGELLKGVLHQVRPGASAVTALDYESGEEVVIPLDPSRSAADNLARIFTRYQKAQKGRVVLERQLAEVRVRRAAVDRLLAEFEALGAAASLDRLRDFAERREMREAIGRQRRGGGSPKAVPVESVARGDEPSRPFAKLPARLRPKVYRTAAEMEIWVGRSDEGNDYLTTRLARGNDLFFHLEGAPGSHVILRTGGRKDPPPEAILDACELAVHFSKRRDEGRADVHVALIKDVKKPARAKPGLVHVLRGRTVHLRRDRARLERLLG